MTATESKTDAPVTRGCSADVRYGLVRSDGQISPMKFATIADAAEAAGHLWPGQEQDPDRTGNGWDVQVVGS